MKNIINLGFLFLFTGCSSINTKDIIPYFIGFDAEKSIYEEVSKSTEKDVVFYIEHLADTTLKFHLINSRDNDFLITNRKLFINDRFYPVIFDTDYLFYSEIKNGHPIISFEVKKNTYEDISIPSIEEREKNIELYGYKKKLLIIDNSIYWVVDKKGKLLHTNSINKK
ncbi:hypothetical protein [Flavobacterium reichenbachii]|uniref:Lipoprotein n=1 Tax=Flavobacterium reichenbachii TaxID=362418 RepID=A0A085ZFG9_9FLAO|nr:hypothetical protein [Flavobacterium reichenbachii]KFF03183.1 hypothetical protein IW19_19900 [Flavobacterium reichenbachii]OXB15161.1 hypothetical protein B0A68_10540 [Flavobacterium reichenbachii]